MTYMCATRWLYLAVILAVSGVARPQVEGTRTVANTSAADGARNLSNESPALTGERRPQYRLHKSDVVEIRFAFSPEFDQTVTIQPDGYIVLKDAGETFVEGMTTSEAREAVSKTYA